jgi:hypothetical protein
VTVGEEEQATVEPGQPPSVPEPMSDEERTLWATEGEVPELAPPVEVDWSGDMLYCLLHGPAGDPASRSPMTGFDIYAQGGDVAQIVVEQPSGQVFVLSPSGDMYGDKGRFGGHFQGLPQAGGTYTFTALDASGTPIPGAVASEVYLGGHEPDPPSNVQAELVEAGILVTWDPSPTIPGAFDPSGSPPFGSYAMYLNHDESGELIYGWGQDGPLAGTSHLVPFRPQDFGPGDEGSALEEMDDGVYNLSLNAFSVAPEGTAGKNTECIANDPTQSVRIVIEEGQVRIEEP